MSSIEKRSAQFGRLNVHSTGNPAGTAHVIVLAGELDAYGCPELEAELARVQANGASQIVVDLSRLGFIDSSGIAMLVAAMRRDEKRPDRLMFVPSQSEDVQRLLEICGLSDQLPLI